MTICLDESQRLGSEFTPAPVIDDDGSGILQPATSRAPKCSKRMYLKCT